MAAKLEIQNLYKVYGDRAAEAIRLVEGGLHPREVLSRTGQVAAVTDVSFSVAEGEIFTIMGLSGSGKSTLVRCINRIIEPSAGRVFVDGEDIVGKSRAALRELRRHKIAMVFQSFALLPHRTVLENVEFGLMLRGEPAEERRRKSRAALDQVGLSDWGERYPDNLSGGMKQRVGLARALASDPDILLMDEPFSALDPLIRSDLQRELLRLQRAIRKTIVFITHDFHEAVKLSDKLAVMRDGRFVQVGSPHDIVLRPVDDYVGTFARELDRSKVLRAGDVTAMRVPVAPAASAPGAVRELMLAAGKPHAVLVDEAGRPAGYVGLEDLRSAGPPNGRAAGAFLAGAAPSVPASAPLAQLYGRCGGSGPVAIVDAGGVALGAVDAADVLMQLDAVARGEAAPRAPAAHAPSAAREEVDAP